MSAAILMPFGAGSSIKDGKYETAQQMEPPSFTDKVPAITQYIRPETRPDIFGILGTVLPLRHHPVRVAEEYALTRLKGYSRKPFLDTVFSTMRSALFKLLGLR